MSVITKMHPGQYDAIESLRDSGFAVVVFYPQELEGVDPSDLESNLVEYGNSVISILSKAKETP